MFLAKIDWLGGLLVLPHMVRLFFETKRRMFRPLLPFIPNNYFRAFVIASFISAIVIPVSAEIHYLLRKFAKVPVGVRVIVNLVVTFVASFVVLVSMRLLFGIGGSYLAGTDKFDHSFWRSRLFP